LMPLNDDSDAVNWRNGHGVFDDRRSRTIDDSALVSPHGPWSIVASHRQPEIRDYLPRP
jgi:hypothetical protein